MKFRIKTLGGDIVYSYGSLFKKENGMFYVTVVGPWYEQDRAVIESTIEYCTGVQDLRGRPIYEGDYVMADDGRGEGKVVFYKGCFMVDFNAYYKVPLYLVDCTVLEKDNA